MNSIVAGLRSIEENLDVVARDAFDSEAIPELSAAEIAEVLTMSGRIQRRLEGLQIEATAQVCERSEGMRDDKMTHPASHRVGDSHE